MLGRGGCKSFPNEIFDIDRFETIFLLEIPRGQPGRMEGPTAAISDPHYRVTCASELLVTPDERLLYDQLKISFISFTS